MKTCTVAYVTQIVSATAVMAGARHQGSLRSVRAEICALVLVGATDACVIDVSALGLIGIAPRLAYAPCPSGARPRCRENPIPLNTTSMLRGGVPGV